MPVILLAYGRGLPPMGMPAARVTDMHTCPMVTGLVPHVGGPIIPPCAPTVLIGGLPAARVTDKCICVGPLDMIVKGSASVLIMGQPAARIGDLTTHGGVIVTGQMNVLIGDLSSGGAGASAPKAGVSGSPDPSLPKGLPKASGEPPALSRLEAKQVFDHFRGDSSIPWNYPNDCCYNRAHVMAKELQAASVPVGKAWNYMPSDGGPLKVSTPNDPKGYVEWGYHVAPTVPVRQADGSIQNMVIDPSMTDGPITPEEWKSKQGQNNSSLVETDASPYYRNVDGRVSQTPSDEEVAATFDQHRADRKILWGE